MKNISFLLLFTVLVGCKSESGSTTFSAEPAPIVCTDDPTLGMDSFGELVSIFDGTAMAYYVEEDADYIWYKHRCHPYFFAINKIDGSIRQSKGLIYSDESCQNPTHEIFDYPLHYSGDIYVFMFDGVLYDYPLGGFIGELNDYYYKDTAGICTQGAEPVFGARAIEYFSETLF